MSPGSATTFQEATKYWAAIDKPELPWVTFSYEDAKGDAPKRLSGSLAG